MIQANHQNSTLLSFILKCPWCRRVMLVVCGPRTSTHSIGPNIRCGSGFSRPWMCTRLMPCPSHLITLTWMEGNYVAWAIRTSLIWLDLLVRSSTRVWLISSVAVSFSSGWNFHIRFKSYFIFNDEINLAVPEDIMQMNK